VCGGDSNVADSAAAFIGGGGGNITRHVCAAVVGGWYNTASGYGSTIAGGGCQEASGYCAAVAGGTFDTVAGDYGFAANYSSYVPFSCDNAAAFNGQTATSSSQTRVGILSKASGTFTIDHPLDPEHKILNHYFVESPEMVLIYRGTAVISEEGRSEIHLPDYFDALNDEPIIYLTGVGTSDVYVVENVKNNAFMIGGKAGAKVNWMVTGARKDPSAEITKVLMPVEQVKEGGLAGRSLDDDFLSVTLEQLQDMGQAAGFDFRTAAGREKHERMKGR
jgi:hypothetical protein